MTDYYYAWEKRKKLYLLYFIYFAIPILAVAAIILLSYNSEHRRHRDEFAMASGYFDNRKELLDQFLDAETDEEARDINKALDLMYEKAVPLHDLSCVPRKTSCSQMRSCTEAVFFHRQCYVMHLDGDHDGIPCEQLCN